MINVLCFAHIKELTGAEKVQIQQDEMTVEQLLNELNYRYGVSGDFMVAVNEEYADKEDIVKSGDTVAIIPPVSGG
ncbi:molybdopterin converting factor subunit 1 [Fictibacillus iocasae]|uniref:Molybdopterin synthase sulfur carrier subunit n=1 Tax=Fictibacillus iocasae TaxID=2715437 RepID=A0ABW2NNA2_9BACL